MTTEAAFQTIPLACGEWRWANERGANGMITVEEAEWLGYRTVAQHPAYPTSWLMRRDG